MKKPAVLVALFLVAASGGFWWFQNQPLQRINRTADQLFDTVAHQKISVRTPDDTRESLGEILAEKITLAGLPGYEDVTLEREELLNAVATFHQMTSYCEFTEIERSHQLSDSRAQLYRTVKVAVAAGPDTRTERTYRLIIDLKKEDRWRINGIRASAP